MDAPGHSFRTTRWSLVQRAKVDDAGGRSALNELCALYWPAVVGFLRRSGLTPEDAQDTAQGLFTQLLERRDLVSLDPSIGRFRGWLRTAARNAAINRAASARTERRGGGRPVFSIDGAAVDDAGLARVESWLEPLDDETPERAFDRLWALATLERAWERLRDEQVARGRGELFDALRPWLEGNDGSATYAELAPRFATTEGALKVAVHRWRQRLRELLVTEVRDTLPEGDDGIDELGELLDALG
jgi:RNA polymerase sigma-70 factor (ECF subfamily)